MTLVISAATCWLSCSLSTRLQSINSTVFCQLGCDMSADNLPYAKLALCSRADQMQPSWHNWILPVLQPTLQIRTTPNHRLDDSQVAHLDARQGYSKSSQQNRFISSPNRFYSLWSEENNWIAHHWLDQPSQSVCFRMQQWVVSWGQHHNASSTDDVLSIHTRACIGVMHIWALYGELEPIAEEDLCRPICVKSLN